VTTNDSSAVPFTRSTGEGGRREGPRASARDELLLELLSEEIPAGMQRRAIAELEELLRNKLAAAEIPAAAMRGYVTPRRLAVIAAGIPATQPDRTEERRGPRVGAPAPAIEGFLRSAGLASIEECKARDTGRGEFYFATIERSGRPAAEVLPELIKAAIFELPWPKSMRYPASSCRWIRPLTSVICLFDGEVLPLSLDRVAVGRLTRGHRFLSPGEICVGNAGEYLDQLEGAYVLIDQDRRKERIREDLERAAAAEGLILKPDPALLEEVTGLVEFPVVLDGAIDADFMALPPEVLATAMRTHQKYFSCLQPDGTPAPKFLFVANNRAADGGKTIIAGNERVLRARLADARFFWDQDRRVPLEARVESLKGRVFHAKLGSVYEKAQRIGGLAYDIARLLGPKRPEFRGEIPKLSKKAAHLAKADLSTGMVGEFPELQGIMGRYYAQHSKEDDGIADAIADHYRPLGPSDNCPTAPISIAVALADKIDTLVGFFGVGETPSGSRDPFALRRAALGVIRLILENDLRLQLRNVFSQAASNFDPARYGLLDPSSELLVFVADRLKVHLRDRGVRHDLISAVFARVISPVLGEAEDDLVRLHTRAYALQAFLAREDGANLLVAYRRASNIVVIEERRDERSYDDEVDPTLLRQPEEQALAEGLAEVGERAGTFLKREEFEAAMSELARLRRPVDDFFDKVTVNCDDAALRENRLRLLSRIQRTLDQVAEFSQIEG
jgi:glycyl-tRNA synthetase beta chain